MSRARMSSKRAILWVAALTLLGIGLGSAAARKIPHPKTPAPDPDKHNAHNGPAAGFPLAGRHARLACDRCHTTSGVFSGAPRDCRGCHSTPRHGDFGVCERCHTPAGWFDTSFSHAATGFALDGRHEDNLNATCEACHDVLRKGTFGRPDRTCVPCHADPHGGAYTSKRVAAGCATCHTAAAWSTPTIDAANHQALFNYPLTEGHAKVPCAACHEGDKARAARRGPPGQCSACHDARHGLAYGADCSACHDPRNWKMNRPMDHQATLAPLDRRHRALPCVACHDPSRRTRLSPECASCHGDPHRGRTQNNCEDCHRADRWSLVRFDHDRTLYPLLGRHFLTPCRNCHTNDQFTGLSSDCITCHRNELLRANDHNKDHRRYPVDCGECHRPIRW